MRTLYQAMCRFFPNERSTRAAGVVLMAFAVPILLSRVSRLEAQQPPAARRTVWDGVYTLAQAKRGALKSGLCTSCHGDGFTGGSAPDLAGEPFMSRWGGKSVGDLFDLIRLTMPDDDPGSLPREEYADLVAYILAVNKFPAGEVEIGTSIEPLQQIQISAAKP